MKENITVTIGDVCLDSSLPSERRSLSGPLAKPRPGIFCRYIGSADNSAIAEKVIAFDPKQLFSGYAVDEKQWTDEGLPMIVSQRVGIWRRVKGLI
ncbi:hypothetical protein HYU94_01500 [Candidatus Daviesbacteria bacterium]|nr:hypothetical protein [Candidatus Daviesbacteria bacterium]